jgi:probable rRNA maturation factor
MTAVRATVPLRVDLQVAVDEPVIPAGADWKAWVGAALAAGGRVESGSVTVRLVTEDESAALNLSYRNKSGPTNVLAFPGPGEAVIETGVEMELGDLAICLPVACREADEQGKQAIAHLTHLVVHGVLHLIGYDHEHEADAERMESLEIRILDELGIANPYVVPEQMNDTKND